MSRVSLIVPTTPADLRAADGPGGRASGPGGGQGTRSRSWLPMSKGRPSRRGSRRPARSPCRPPTPAGPPPRWPAWSGPEGTCSSCSTRASATTRATSRRSSGRSPTRGAAWSTPAPCPTARGRSAAPVRPPAPPGDRDADPTSGLIVLSRGPPSTRSPTACTRSAGSSHSRSWPRSTAPGSSMTSAPRRPTAGRPIASAGTTSATSAAWPTTASATSPASSSTASSAGRGWSST